MRAKPRRFDAAAFLRRWRALNALLGEHGFHELSVWWDREVERFIRALATGRRRWVIRAGRRAGKSSTLARLAVCWGLWGEWSVPTGDAGIIAFISTNKDEASARLRTIAEVLRALGIDAHEAGQEIEIVVAGKGSLVFKVFACSITGVVGPTIIGLFGDEVSHWESRDSYANPAGEVLGASRPALATQPFGFEVLSSAPWGDDDHHAELFHRGDTSFQITSFAETWVANPTITEERTHELEPDEKRWAQAYAAREQGSLTKAFELDDLLACYTVTPAGDAHTPFLSTDASSLRHDGFAWVQGHQTTASQYVVIEVGAWEGAELKTATLESITASLASRAQSIGAAEVLGDQREAAGLTTLFAQRGVSFRFFSWTEDSKDQAVQFLRRLMRERRLSLCAHDGLKNELRDLKARTLPSGRIAYETNGLDYASALITLAHAAVLDGPAPWQSPDWDYMDRLGSTALGSWGSYGGWGTT